LHMRNADLHRDLSFILCSLDWFDDLKESIYAALQVSLQLQLDTYLFDDQHDDDYDEYQDSYIRAYQQDLQLQDFREQQCYSASATAFPRDFVEYDNHIVVIRQHSTNFLLIVHSICFDHVLNWFLMTVRVLTLH
jgi:hypothetical protein